MNRMIYLMPLASFPLMALAQQSADDSMKTDNPYVSAVIIFVVAMSVTVALIAYFRLRTRGRVTAGIVFGIVDWLITASLSLSAGVNTYVSLGMATLSSALFVFTAIRYGRNLAAFFTKQDAADFDTDKE